MTEPSLAHILRLVQELTYEFHETNLRLSNAWLELERARATLRSLMMIYDEWLKEKELDRQNNKNRW
ncbi:MAG: hypothetical protein KBD90_02875 [Alphaproteobacteria bacterium]|nr:hypothetical protein [Alphaproteobacteria bacterium]